MKLKFLFTFFGLFILGAVHSQVTNTGVLKIENGTTVLFLGDYTNQSTGEMTNAGSLVIAADYINEGKIIKSNGLTSFESTTDDIQLIASVNDTLYFNKIIVDNKLKGVAVRDSLLLIINESIHLEEGSLKLIGKAELIQNGAGSNANTGVSGTLDKEMDGISSGYAYTYWSSPVHNGGAYRLKDVLYDGTDTGVNPFNEQAAQYTTGLDGQAAIVDGDGKVVTPMKVSSYWLYLFVDNNKGYPGWKSINENSKVDPGVGFTMKGSNTSASQQPYVFKGIPNSGDYSLTLKEGNTYLIGNPYPSSMDADAFLTDNLAVFDELYYWVDGGTNSHHLSEYQGGYATYNLTAGAPVTVPPPGMGGIGDAGESPDDIIAPGQGFFVVSDGGATQIEFNNSQRTFGKKTKLVGASEKKKADSIQAKKVQKSIIRLAFKNSQGYVRQIVLGFVPNSAADINYNRGYDAEMFDTHPEEMYFILRDKPEHKFIIQGVGEFDKELEIPIGFEIAQTGGQQIFVEEFENFSHEVYIKDNVLGVAFQIDENPFDFNLKAGSYTDRFSVVFKPTSKVEREDALKNAVQVYFNEGMLMLKNQYNLEIDQVMVTNTLGQLVLNTTLKNPKLSEYAIPFKKAEGVYFIQIKTKSEAAAYKRINN